MEYRVHGGCVDLVAPAPGGFRLDGLAPEVQYVRGGRRETWRPPLQRAADGATAALPGGLEMRLRFAAHAGAIVVHVTLRNGGSAPIFLSRLTPLALDTAGNCELGAGSRPLNVLRQGFQSWTGTRAFRSLDVDRDPWPAWVALSLIDVRNPSPQRPGHFRSDTFAVVEDPTGPVGLVVGFLDCRRAFGGVEVRLADGRCRRLVPGLDYDDVTVPPDGEVVAAPLWIGAGGRTQDVLAAYLDAAAAEMQARVPPHDSRPRPNPTGWCSWYYYFTRVGEEAVLENLRALTELRDRFPSDYVQVDDGYQTEIGDWLTTNRKFPRGMKWLAGEIRDAGFDAGIWTAPFIARPGSQLMRSHPDWFVRDAGDKPRFALWNPLWGLTRGCYALDTTHPEVLQWLRDTFRTIVHDWGYRVLKLDFLFAASLPGRRHDPGATRAEALRRGLEAIRAAAGDEAFLLGCGCPLGPAVGVVDAMRIGPDVAPFWSNFLTRGAMRDMHGVATKHAVRNTLTRAFLHRRWWLNDPDCLMLRDSRTKLTKEEVRTLATAIAVTDGMIVLSDRLRELGPAALEALDRTLALAGGVCEAVDLMDADVPELVVTRSPDHVTVAVFNFADSPRRKQVDLAALGIAATDAAELVEWWTGARVPVSTGVADFGPVPAHGCRVLRLAPGRQ